MSHLQWQRYAEYLRGLKGAEYQRHVFEYIEAEDTPRPLLFQLDLLREAGFSACDLLHGNGCFAAFGAVKGRFHKPEAPATDAEQLSPPRGPSAREDNCFTAP